MTSINHYKGRSANTTISDLLTEKAKSDISDTHFKNLPSVYCAVKKELSTKELIISLLKINLNYYVPVFQTLWLSFLT